MTLENRLLRALGGADGPPPGAAVLLAVSGGIDSMTLLEVTAELVRRGRLEIRPVAAHLHHGIRGQDADEDQRLVEAACRRLGIALHTDRVEIPPGPSLEDRARRARRRFLADTARRFSARHVLLAHQADDQAETVLDRVLAGAGPEGLAGMRPRAVLPVDRGESLVVLRPWLEVPRSAIAHRAAAQGIAFREDRTNRETRWRRGRLRHAVMPYLREAVNPALTAAMLRLGSVMRGTAELLEAAAKDALVGVVRTPPPALAWLVDRHPEEVVALDRRAFRALAAPLQGAVLRLAMRQLDRVQPPVPGHRALGDLARRLAGGGGTGPWRVRRGLHAVMDGATVLLARRPLVLRDTRAHAVIATPGGAPTVPLPGVHVTIGLRAPAKHPPPRTVLWLDADRTGVRVRIRPVQRDDRFAPAGADATVPLWAHLRRRSWSGFRRALALAVTDPDDGPGLHGVLGLGASGAAGVTEATQRVLEIAAEGLYDPPA